MKLVTLKVIFVSLILVPTLAWSNSQSAPLLNCANQDKTVELVVERNTQNDNSFLVSANIAGLTREGKILMIRSGASDTLFLAELNEGELLEVALDAKHSKLGVSAYLNAHLKVGNGKDLELKGILMKCDYTAF
jgi:hypothetical protein